jgi:hypothetical protein
MMLEVRCCCQPAKLLGWIELPETPTLGARVNFALAPALGAQQEKSAPLELVSLTWGSWTSTRDTIVDERTITRIVEQGVAFKSNDTPIETLRRIKGFTEL